MATAAALLPGLRPEKMMGLSRSPRASAPVVGRWVYLDPTMGRTRQSLSVLRAQPVLVGDLRAILLINSMHSDAKGYRGR